MICVVKHHIWRDPLGWRCDTFPWNQRGPHEHRLRCEAINNLDPHPGRGETPPQAYGDWFEQQARRLEQQAREMRESVDWWGMPAPSPWGGST